jgi:hypothetical protein
MDNIINLLERIYANVATLSAYYYNEHTQFRESQTDVDPVEFALWDIEIRLKEAIKQLENVENEYDEEAADESHTGELDYDESWDTSEWDYDGSVDIPVQDTGSESEDNEVQQDAGEEKEQGTDRQHWFSPILK